MRLQIFFGVNYDILILTDHLHLSCLINLYVNKTHDIKLFHAQFPVWDEFKQW